MQEFFQKNGKNFEIFCSGKVLDKEGVEAIRFRFCIWAVIGGSMTEIRPRISVEYRGNAVIVTLSDEKILEDEQIRSLRDSIMSVIEQAGRVNLIVDFRSVRFLSSAVLGLLIRVSKKIYEADGQLRLCHIRPRIQEIFKITRLTKIFDIYPDLDSAIAGLLDSEEV
jgi:anti-sigma B factor antagonist